MYSFSSIGEKCIPKSVKCAHSATKEQNPNPANACRPPLENMPKRKTPIAYIGQHTLAEKNRARTSSRMLSNPGLTRVPFLLKGFIRELNPPNGNKGTTGHPSPANGTKSLLDGPGTLFGVHPGPDLFNRSEDASDRGMSEQCPFNHPCYSLCMGDFKIRTFIGGTNPSCSYPARTQSRQRNPQGWTNHERPYPDNTIPLIFNIPLQLVH